MSQVYTVNDISECLNKRIDLIEISEIHGNSPIYNAITKEGVVLYEREG